jgi:hypothetical protein
VGITTSTNVRIKGIYVIADKNMVRSDRTWESSNVTVAVLETAPFLMQPGVLYYNNLRAWNRAQLPTGVTSQPFMVRRPQDQLLSTLNAGDVTLLSTAFTRRAIVDVSLSQVTVLVPPGAIGNNTLLNLIPLSQADYTATYTFGTGQQLDLFSRERYDITTDTYIHDPTLELEDARQRLNFSGISFGVSPITTDNSTVRLEPIGVRARVPNTWNHSAFSPRWMFWNVAEQTWDDLAALCGPNTLDNVSSLALPTVDISTTVRM